MIWKDMVWEWVDKQRKIVVNTLLSNKDSKKWFFKKSQETVLEIPTFQLLGGKESTLIKWDNKTTILTEWLFVAFDMMSISLENTRPYFKNQSDYGLTLVEWTIVYAMSKVDTFQISC